MREGGGGGGGEEEGKRATLGLWPIPAKIYSVVGPSSSPVPRRSPPDLLHVRVTRPFEPILRPGRRPTNAPRLWIFPKVSDIQITRLTSPGDSCTRRLGGTKSPSHGGLCPVSITRAVGPPPPLEN